MIDLRCPECGDTNLDHQHLISATDLVRKYHKIESMTKGLKEDAALFMKLDKAMATPERIAMDERKVGAFVSNLDMLETAEEIIDRAIILIKYLHTINPDW